MNIINKPLSEYLEEIEQGNHYSFSRFNDGEWLCIFDSPGANVDGCSFKPAGVFVRKALLNHRATYHGIHQYLFNEAGLGEQVKKYLNDCKDFDTFGEFVNAIYKDSEKDEHDPRLIKLLYWYDSDIFHDASSAGELQSVVDVFNKRNICMVAPRFLQDTKRFLNYKAFVTAPEVDAIKDLYRVEAEVLESVRHRKIDLILFCCGYLANVLIDRLVPVIGENCTLLDFGSVFDPYCGRKSRGYMMKEEFKCIL